MKTKIIVKGEWNNYREYRKLWEEERKKQFEERRRNNR